MAAPFAAFVMDARTGQVLYSENADTRLHPASLTKMMTLYIAFEAIEKGEISLDSLVTISSKAANEQPSKLGMRPGQKIKLRYLIRAAAIKSANDAATAIGEAVGGSEAAFARRMNRTAQALGMTRTTFKNANGLTEAGHLSTARDMSILGRHLLYDHPEFYNLFSRRTSDAGGKPVYSTNRRFLDAYDGADGIKTGYTVAAGFNLVASAKRGNERIIATVMGGTSTAMRNAKAAELLDLGFRKAPTNVREKEPSPPVYADDESAPDTNAAVQMAMAEDDDEAGPGAAAKTLRVSGAPARSIRPMARPGAPVPAPSAEMIASMQDNIQNALAAMAEEDSAAPATEAAAVATMAPPPARPDGLVPEAETAAAEPQDNLFAAVDPSIVPPPRPDLDAVDTEEQIAEGSNEEDTVAKGAGSEPTRLALAGPGMPTMEDEDPAAVPAAETDEPLGTLDFAAPAVAEVADDETLLASASPVIEIEPEVFAEAPDQPVVVTRLSTSGGRNWGINVGTYNSRYEAEKVLLRTALMEIGTLDEALRKVGKSPKGFEANFLGMTEDLADLACRRLTARGVGCKPLGPES